MYVDLNWIIGFSIGVEYTNRDYYDYLAIDLGIFRIVLIKDNLEE